MRQGFRQDEAEQILTEAVRRTAEERAMFAAAPVETTEIPPERLQAMAEELGIPLATLEAVLQERELAAVQEEEQVSVAEERRRFILERRAGFHPHLISFLGVIGLLWAIYLLTTPTGYPWPLWPMLGWGLGLFIHGALSVPTRGSHFEHEFLQWQERRQRRRAKARKDRVRATSKPVSDDAA